MFKKKKTIKIVDCICYNCIVIMARGWKKIKRNNKTIKEKKMIDCNLPPFKYSIVACSTIFFN